MAVHIKVRIYECNRTKFTFPGYNRLKRELSESRIPSKVVRFDESTEDEGHPILPPTEKPAPVITTETPTTRETEKPVPIFITNRPETTTVRAVRTTTKKVETTTSDDVVARGIPFTKQHY